MSLKIDFVEQASRTGANVSELCREFGISRETGHKWLKRFREHGFDGLEEQSRRPHNVALASSEDVVVEIVVLRRAHPTWGPRKLRGVLVRSLKDDTPTERTIARILTRLGAIRTRRKRPPLSIVERAPVVAAKASNDVWTIDFKGWWLAKNGERCEPLTVRDAYSRFVLAIELIPTSVAAVKRVLERLFAQYGVPKAIQCDNGPPFICVRSRGGLSRLSAWWTALGVATVRSRLASPQDNAAHERMHADMAHEIESDPAKTRRRQQSVCSKWRQTFNHVRPHDALAGKTPAEVYRPKVVRMQEAAPEYPKGWLTRRVNYSGRIRVGGASTFISEVLRGYTIGLQHISGLRYRGRFFAIDLGEIEIQPHNRLLQRCESSAGIKAIRAVQRQN